MLEPLQNKINSLGASKIYVVWGKYYLKNIDPPRDLFKQYPQLEQFSSLIKYKAIDKNEFKTKLKLMNTKDDIEKVLVQTFKLDSQLNLPLILNFFTKASESSISKSNKKVFKPVYCAAIRFFIQIAYQSNSLFDNAIRGQNVDFMDKIKTIPQFFSQFQGKYFNNFLIIVVPFLSIFISKLPMIFKDTSNPALKSTFIYLISTFLTLASSETAFNPGQPSQIVTNIIQIIGGILNIYKSTNWDVEFVRGLFLLFSQLSANINSSSRQGIELVICNISFVFNSLQQCTNVQPNELYQLSVACLQCFQFCIELEKIENDLVLLQVPNIVCLIQWLVKYFSKDQNTTLEKAVLKDLKDPTDLGPINMNAYFSYMDTIRYTSPKLRPELNQSLEKIKSIVKLFNDPVSFLKSLVNKAFSVNLEQLPDCHLYIIFIAELIFRFDERLVEKSFSGSWNHLFKPEIFPIKVGVTYDKTLTECCLLIMLRCIMYDEVGASTSAIFENIANFAKTHGEIVFSYFINLFNSLLVGVDQNSAFMSTFSKSSNLLGILISIAQRRLAFYDLIRNLVVKSPNYAFSSNEIDFLICQTFPDEKRSKSSAELIQIGLKLARTAPESTLSLIGMIGTTISRMLSAKMPKAIEMFRIVAQSQAIFELPDSIVLKLGPTFDAFSFIPIVFPNELVNILNYFIHISKKSPSIANALQSPDSKIYSNLSKACEINSNENIINLLFSLATNDSMNIVNSRALELVLERAKMSPKELQIILKVDEMCEKSHDNLKKVCTSEVPGFIISRISTVSDQQTKNLLFSLYKKIVSYNFTVSTFFSTIVIIFKPTFDMPQTITEIYSNLIKSQKSSIQNGSILSVFTAQNVGPNILPLFRRLNGCEKCASDIKGINYCPNCGALKMQDGVKYVSCILYFLAKMLKVSIHFNNVFYKLNGPQLLVQFLSQIKSIYLNKEVIDKLFKIFKKIQHPDLAINYVESIWMNFDFISQFSEEDHNYFFGKIPDAYELNKKAFCKRTIVESVLFKLMNEKSDSNSYALLSSLLNSLVSGANSKSLLSTFFSILYDNSSPALTDSILNMTYMLIVTNNKTMLDILDEFSYFKPFVPLMAIPNSNIQKLSLQCIMKMPTAKTDTMKLYSTMIQCSVAYNKSDNDEIIFKQLNDYIEAMPNLLPFWATVVRNFNDSRRIDESFNQLRKNDSDLQKFADVPIWFYWLFTIKKFSQDEIANLIFDSKNELKVKELSLLFDFFEIYQSEIDIDFTSIRTSILKTLLTKSFTNSEASKTNLRIIFYYLFFIKIKPQKAKRFNCLEHFLDKKLALFSEKARYPSVFHLKIDEKTGKWIDATFANEVLTKVTPESSFYVEFSRTFRVHSFVLFAYIARTLNRFTRKTNLEISALFEPLLQKADIVTAYIVASILCTSWKLPMLDEYLDYYHDDRDSPEYQIFKFEDRMSQSASVNTFTQLLNETIEKAIVVSIPLKEPDDDVSVKSFCSYSDPAIYKPILDNFSEFKQKQSSKIMQDKMFRSKLLANFMTKLQLGCGPWALKTNQLRFVMFNSTSPRGVRNIMKIFSLPNSTTDLSSKNAKTQLFQTKLVDIQGVIDGDISIVKNSILFEGKDSSRTKIDIPSSDIVFVFKRNDQLYPYSIEIFSIDNRSYLFAFANLQVLDTFLKQLDRVISSQRSDKFVKSKFNIYQKLSLANPSIIQKVTTTEIYLKMNLLKLWQMREISNFQYIYYLNLLLGRTYHMIESYPIFPAIAGICDQINFTNPKFFAPFPSYQPSINGDDVSNYLCRLVPFNVPFSKLKNKKPLRDASEINIGFQELYYLPAFLINENQFVTIENVKLPQWAQNNPYRYVSILRRALETDYVSMNLPKWLDEAFGKCFLFATPHQPRNVQSVPRPAPYQNADMIPSEFPLPLTSVLRIKKQICICNNNLGFDFRNNKSRGGYVQFKIPSDIHGSVLAASRVQPCVVIGKKNEASITILVLGPNSVDVSAQTFILSPNPSSSSLQLIPIQQQQAQSNTNNINNVGGSNEFQFISCAAILGDKYLVIAFDCNLSVYRISNESGVVKEVVRQKPPSAFNRMPGAPQNQQSSTPPPTTNTIYLSELSTTSFHNSQVICVAGNAELGLIASIDKEYNLVIETLYNETFIRSIPLPLTNAASSQQQLQQQQQRMTPFIEVFKSGIIIVVLAGQMESKIFLYDTRGKLIGGQNVQGRIVETDKIYFNFAFEYLVVGIENVGIRVLDVIDLREDKRFDIPEFSGKFTTIAKTRAVVAENRGKLVLIKF